MLKQSNEVSMNVAVKVLAVLTVVFAAAAVYFYLQSSDLSAQLQALKQDPQKIVQQENEALISKIGSLIVLPEGETPTIATVNDPELLKDQPFFAKAQKGDKVLIYALAKKAILYNPDSNKIIEVAPLTIGSATEPSAGLDSNSEPQQ